MSNVKCQMSKIAIFAFGALIFLSGCATCKEKAKGFLGVSTKQLEEDRKNAMITTYPLTYNACYQKVKDFIKIRKSYIYAENAKKQMIAVYYSETDTTPIGIFLRVVDPSNTEVAITSPSDYMKELFAKEMSETIEKSLKQEGAVAGNEQEKK